MINDNTFDELKKSLLCIQFDIYQNGLNSEEFSKKYKVFYTKKHELGSKCSSELSFVSLYKILTEYFNLKISKIDLISLINERKLSSFIIWGTRYHSDLFDQDYRYIEVLCHND